MKSSIMYSSIAEYNCENCGTFSVIHNNWTAINRKCAWCNEPVTLICRTTLYERDVTGKWQLVNL